MELAADNCTETCLQKGQEEVGPGKKGVQKSDK